MQRLAVLAVLLALAATACGETGPGAVGVSGGVETLAAVTVPADCVAQAESVRKQWEAALAAGAQQDPETRFPNLEQAEFEERLRTAAAEFGFRVVDLRWLMPLQAAPAVVVQWDDPDRLDDPEALREDVDEVFGLLDPREPETFEGFYFEARDAVGMPFLVTGLYSRGDDKGGIQWTRFHEFILRGVPEAIARPRDLVCQ